MAVDRSESRLLVLRTLRSVVFDLCRRKGDGGGSVGGDASSLTPWPLSPAVTLAIVAAASSGMEGAGEARCILNRWLCEYPRGRRSGGGVAAVA